MLHRSIDAGITSQLLNSDHYALFLKLRVMRLLERKTESRHHTLNLDHHKSLFHRLKSTFLKVNYTGLVM